MDLTVESFYTTSMPAIMWVKNFITLNIIFLDNIFILMSTVMSDVEQFDTEVLSGPALERILTKHRIVSSKL